MVCYGEKRGRVWRVVVYLCGERFLMWCIYGSGMVEEAQVGLGCIVKCGEVWCSMVFSSQMWCHDLVSYGVLWCKMWEGEMQRCMLDLFICGVVRYGVQHCDSGML